LIRAGDDFPASVPRVIPRAPLGGLLAGISEIHYSL
jgi:hypothetical protein